MVDGFREVVHRREGAASEGNDELAEREKVVLLFKPNPGCTCTRRMSARDPCQPKGGEQTWYPPGGLPSHPSTSSTPHPPILTRFLPVTMTRDASRFRTANPEPWIALIALPIWTT